MSGSPIIQNGKLVGAVTHVLVNSPDTGYGIFIENMLTLSLRAGAHTAVGISRFFKNFSAHIGGFSFHVGIAGI